MTKKEDQTVKDMVPVGNGVTVSQRDDNGNWSDTINGVVIAHAELDVLGLAYFIRDEKNQINVITLEGPCRVRNTTRRPN